MQNDANTFLWNTWIFLIFSLKRFGRWLDGFSLSLCRDPLGTSSPGLTSPHWKPSSTSRTHQFFSTFLTAPPGKSLFYFSRKSRETSSSAELSLLSPDVERNFNPAFKHIFYQWFPSCRPFWNTKESWTTPTRLHSFSAWHTLQYTPWLDCFHTRFFIIPSSSSHPLSQPSILHSQHSPLHYCVCVW